LGRETPRSVDEQVDRLVAGFRDILGDNLHGIYLHGSLALGCFNPARSDIDVLVVVD
jgi:streptomycin 3"-adenylyltransferase